MEHNDFCSQQKTTVRLFGNPESASNTIQSNSIRSQDTNLMLVDQTIPMHRTHGNIESPARRKPMCSNGIPGIESSKGACCVAACGRCGGMGCSMAAMDKGLGSTECCEGTILLANELCGEAPCVLGDARWTFGAIFTETCPVLSFEKRCCLFAVCWSASERDLLAKV